MSTFDELDARFNVGEKLRAAIERRFGKSAKLEFSVRWWPRRDAPTSAFVVKYPSARDGPDHSMPMSGAWFIVSRDVVEEPTTGLLSRAIEYMSPIPDTSVMSVVDAYDFFQLGRALRDKPSTLATDLAEVWHAPKVLEGRLVFFALSDGQFRRISIDLETARVDDTPL